jgi:hypothetical protein
MLTIVHIIKNCRRCLAAAALVLLALPREATACEPIVPLSQLIGGSGVAGTLLLTRSITWLLIAVAIKSLAFVLLERRLPWSKALCFMLLGNVLSTIPGVLTAVFAGSLVLLTIPIIYGFGVVAEHRLSLLHEHVPTRRFKGNGMAAAFTGAYVLSVVMFYFAGSALNSNRYAGYWLVKILFTTVAVAIGMGISTILEEYMVARFARKEFGICSFYTPVLRANYITLGVVLLVAAVQILPKRLAAPHFIVSWLHTVSSFLGIT